MATVATGLSAARVLRHSARRFGGGYCYCYCYCYCSNSVHPIGAVGIRSPRNLNHPFRSFSATATATATATAMATKAANLAAATATATTSSSKPAPKTDDDSFTKTGNAGRSRKRPRPWRRKNPDDSTSFENETKTFGSTRKIENTDRSLVQKTQTATIDDVEAKAERSVLGANERDDDESSSLPYPEGKPWRVLWPYPHGEPTKSPRPESLWDYRKRIPTPKHFRRAWEQYKETWEDGIRGIPTERQHNNNDDGTTSNDNDDDEAKVKAKAKQQLQEVGDNATKNLKIVREDAQTLLEHAKDTTGIRSQDDAKALASEVMKIATECIKEFMAGYRKGRDSEIDKMLHEYFQEEEKDEDVANGGDKFSATSDVKSTTKKQRKKRKPKRGLPRT